MAKEAGGGKSGGGKAGAKEVTAQIKLQVPAGSANPAPPIGPALGQRGVNIMDFCKAFNAETAEMEKGVPIPTLISVFGDKSFVFETKTPPASYLIKKAAKLEKGGATPGRVGVGSITLAQAREIAALKRKDLNARDEDAAVRIIAGTARAIGIQVLGET